MADQPDPFRDFGILPREGAAPPLQVRAYFSTGRLIAQYLGTAMVCVFGLVIASALAFALTFPSNILAPAVPLVGAGIVIYFVTRNDYCWVELDGKVIRAKHLYTRRVIERRVEEIEDLFT